VSNYWNNQVEEYAMDRAFFTRERKRCAYNLVGIPAGMRSLGRPGYRWDDLREMAGGVG
jgi:hypothetical protein